ncbi:hypothetical protein SCLCIDRAFT_837490 [Scleroderma citrinum Foug A]|uniref:Uncharacterized protein n=1 Tax=Scleroderma citrinum Foug A TaxID=1036808 RepID=A0A0C2ZKT8_9AGAM|nr:hypothetical protein SCLCIDRAFT_837490 [Scleroderma citrinum Foug A]
MYRSEQLDKFTSHRISILLAGRIHMFDILINHRRVILTSDTMPTNSIPSPFKTRVQFKNN